MPLFDDEGLVSCAGLVPVLALTERAGLSELISTRVAIGSSRVKSAAADPAGKLASIIAGTIEVPVFVANGDPMSLPRGLLH